MQIILNFSDFKPHDSYKKNLIRVYMSMSMTILIFQLLKLEKGKWSVFFFSLLTLALKLFTSTERFILLNLY